MRSGDAEAAASAVRPADDRLAGRRRARCRRQPRRRRRQPRSPTRGRARRDVDARDPAAAPRNRRRRQGRRPTDLAPGNTVVVLNGDVPLISAEAIRSLVQAHERSGAAATIGDRDARRRRAATAASSATPTARCDASSRRRRRATRPSSSFTSERSTPGCSPSTATRCSTRWTRSAPTTPRASSTCRMCSRSCGPTSGRSSPTSLADPTETLGINDRVALADVDRDRPAPDPRAAHARRRDDRQSRPRP